MGIGGIMTGQFIWNIFFVLGVVFWIGGMGISAFIASLLWYKDKIREPIAYYFCGFFSLIPAVVYLIILLKHFG